MICADAWLASPFALHRLSPGLVPFAQCPTTRPPSIPRRTHMLDRGTASPRSIRPETASPTRGLEDRSPFRDPFVIENASVPCQRFGAPHDWESLHRLELLPRHE